MRPRRAVAVLALGALLAGPAGAAPEAAPPAAPAIRFDQAGCDFGTVVQGEQPSCVLAFSNDGGAELRVLDVEPTCGCTSALVTAPVVPPGKRGSVSIAFDSSNFAGDVVKEITVRSSDPARPAVVLTIRALVEPEIDFEPRQVSFDEVRPGDRRVEQVVLTNRSSGPVEIRSLEASPQTFACRVPAWADPARPLVVEPWDRLQIEVAMSAPPTVAMPIAGECAFTIHGPRKTRFTLKILALP
jgi:hypothetical protein